MGLNIGFNKIELSSRPDTLRLEIRDVVSYKKKEKIIGLLDAWC